MSDGTAASAYPDDQPKKSDKGGDGALLEEMRRRYRYVHDTEQENNEVAEESVRFLWGEQWPAELRAQREANGQPVLTNNQLTQFRNQVINDVRQNKPAIKVHPASDDASEEIAEIQNGIIRHVERKSNADRAYVKGLEGAVDGGKGFWRVITRYVNEQSFDQELAIQQIENPACVAYDPDTLEPDYSDAKFCFVVEQMEREAFKDAYPNASMTSWQDDDTVCQWVDEKHILVVDYFRITTESKTLVKQLDGKVVFKEDLQVPPNAEPGTKLEDILLKDKHGRVIERKTEVPKVEWYKATGAEILETYEWPGKYIPVVKVVGVEKFVDGKRKTKGLIADGLDAQRMYNYNISRATEVVIAHTVSPWIMAEGQDTGYESEWSDPSGLNPVAHYKQVDYGDKPAPPPRREPPAEIPSGLMTMANSCKEDMRGCFGIYDPSLGQRSNETSGRAIMARERQGDNATFHFPDNMNLGIAYTGRILVNMIPHIYDAKRVVRIIGEDDTEQAVTINSPGIKPGPSGEAIKTILNDLSVGDYDVTCEVGPAYGTKRIEAANSMAEFMRVYPPAAPFMGDIYAKTQDWPEAQKIAERLKLMLPPQIAQAEQGQQPLPPQVMQQMQQMQQGIQQLQQQLQGAGQQMQALQQENTSLKQAVQNKQGDIAVKQQAIDSDERMAMLQARMDGMKAEQDSTKTMLDFIAKIFPQLMTNPQAAMMDTQFASQNMPGQFPMTQEVPPSRVAHDMQPPMMGAQ